MEACKHVAVKCINNCGRTDIPRDQVRKMYMYWMYPPAIWKSWGCSSYCWEVKIKLYCKMCISESVCCCFWHLFVVKKAWTMPFSVRMKTYSYGSNPLPPEVGRELTYICCLGVLEEQGSCQASLVLHLTDRTQLCTGVMSSFKPNPIQVVVFQVLLYLHWHEPVQRGSEFQT